MKFAAITNIFHRYNYKKKPKAVKVLEFFLFFIIFLFFAGVIYQFIATEIDKGKFKLRGKLVSVGGYRLMVNTSGSGKYTVVLDGDIGTPIQQWGAVKEELSKQYRVFTYERNGYGWSDSSGEAVNISKAVGDLKKALSRSGVSSPYILVGHGYGSLIMTEFAKKYPNEVVGVILVDSLLEENIKSEEFQAHLDKTISKYGVTRFFSYMGATRLAHKIGFLKLDESVVKKFTEEEKSLFESQRVSSKYYAAYYKELKALKDYKGTMQKKGVIGDKFLVVLADANKYNEIDRDKHYEEQQKKLQELSTNGEFMSVERVDEYIQVDRPDAIVNTINKIVKKAGKLK